MADPKFVDAPGPQFIDAPGPSAGGQKLELPSTMLKQGRWQELLEPYRFQNNTTSVKRPDGAVYIKEANDPRFKGQEGWHYQDPQTGVWVPAPPKDTSAMNWAEKNLGKEAWKVLGRNVKAGFDAPFEAVTGLGHDVANVVGLEGDKRYLENIKNLEERQRYRQALANVHGGKLASGQVLGEALPALAYAAATKQLPPTVGGTPVVAGEGLTAMGQATPYVSRLAQTGLQTMPYAYATTPGTQAERLKAATIGGLTAPLAQAGLEKLVVPTGKAVVGGLRGLMSPEARAVEQAATKEGVTLSTGEVLGKKSRLGRLVQGVEESAEPTMRWFKDTGEGQDQAGQAAKGLLKQVQQKGRAVGFESEDQLRQALKVDPENHQLQALGRLVDGARSGNPADVAQASAALKNWSTRKEVGAIFDKARLSAAQAPVQHSEVTATISNLDRLIGEFDQLPPTTRDASPVYQKLVGLRDDYQRALTEGPTALNASGTSAASLEALSRQSSEATKGQVRFKLDLRSGQITPLIGPEAVDATATRGTAIVQRGTGTKPWTVLDADPAFPRVSDKVFSLRPRLDAKYNSNEVQQALANLRPTAEPVNKDLLSYNGLDRMRSWLGDQARSTTDTAERRAYELVKAGIERDQEALAKANPGTSFAKQFQTAKKRWAQEVVPFEDNAIARAMKTSTPDETYQQFIRRGPLEDRGQKFFNALDPKGQMAVKERLLSDAIDAATDRTQPGQPFDPHKFVGFLDQYRGAKSTIFKGADAEALNGLTNIMQHLKTRPSSSAKPTFFSSLSAGGASLLNTGPVRRLLLAADGLRPGSTKLEQLLTKFTALETGLAGTPAPKSPTTATTEAQP